MAFMLLNLIIAHSLTSKALRIAGHAGDGRSPDRNALKKISGGPPSWSTYRANPACPGEEKYGPYSPAKRRAM